MEKLKQILSEMGLRFRFDTAVIDVLDDHSSRLYALEENRKAKDKGFTELRRELGELRLIVANLSKKC